MRPLVTVGIPFYNAEKTLADAIRSVFAQNYTNWELILVDDGSTDKSLKIARSIDDPRVRVISDGRNLGLAARLNQIAQLARGEYIARMDADDLMHPARLETQVKFLMDHPEVDVVGTGMVILDETGRPVGKRIPRMNNTAYTVLTRGVFMHATVMGKRNWFLANPYDPSIKKSQDRELWARTFARSRFANIPECLYFCWEYSSFSLRKCISAQRTLIRIYRKYAPGLIGRLPTFYLMCRELFKLGVYATAAICGLENKLINRRSNSLTEDEIKNNEIVLASIRSTHLPVQDTVGVLS